MELPPRQERLLAQLGHTQRITGAAGLLLALLGTAYAVWGVTRFDPQGDPRLDPGFDRPVAKLAFLYRGYQGAVDRIRPETATEQVLLETLDDGMKWSAGMLLMLLRLFIGTVAALAGSVMMTVVVERRRLLNIIARLREAPAPSPG